MLVIRKLQKYHTTIIQTLFYNVSTIKGRERPEALDLPSPPPHQRFRRCVKRQVTTVGRRHQRVETISTSPGNWHEDRDWIYAGTDMCKFNEWTNHGRYPYRDQLCRDRWRSRDFVILVPNNRKYPLPIPLENFFLRYQVFQVFYRFVRQNVNDVTLRIKRIVKLIHRNLSLAI